MQAIKNRSLLPKHSLLGCSPWTARLHVLQWDRGRYQQRLQEPSLSLSMLGFPCSQDSSWETQTGQICTYNSLEEYFCCTVLDLLNTFKLPFWALRKSGFMHCVVCVFCITSLSSLSAARCVGEQKLQQLGGVWFVCLFVFLTLLNTLGENSGHSHWVVKIISTLTQICRLTPWEHVETTPHSHPHTYVYTQEQRGRGGHAELNWNA